MKQTCSLLLSVIIALLVCGCESTPSASSASASSLNNDAEGRVVNAEDGFLELRMADGSSKLFMLPVDDTAVPSFPSNINSHIGRKCRIQLKMSVYENAEGEVSRVPEITKFVWL